MDEERRERLRRSMTPELVGAIAAAIQEKRLPAEMLAAVAGDGLKALIDPGPVIRVEIADRPVPVAALEAIVQFVGRPPLLVRADRVELEPLADFPPGTAEKIRRIESTVASVGRVEFYNHDSAWGGTAWVVDRTGSSALVVTNRHVAQLVATNRADGRAVFLRSPSGPPFRASINFGEELDAARTGGIAAPVTGFEYLADNGAADVALLRIETTSFELPAPLMLIERSPRAEDLVALIGYPAYDQRNGHDEQDRYFRGIYGVKRFAPGRILQPGGEGLQLTHDCTSLGGNSGSPLISLDDGKVVGLHFSGLYGRYNAAVDATTLKAVLAGERPVAMRVRTQPTERPDGHHAIADVAGRNGFCIDFLGKDLETPWPRLPTRLIDDLATPSDSPSEPNEIRYTHFGVKYSAALRLPIITAVNIDGARSVRIKRGDDKWFSDPRIPLEIQLTSANFADPNIDRGHMVRREDPNWAPVGSPSEALQADLDTFHYVNAAPQHKDLNRAKTMWLGLESYILDSARIHGFRASVFTGPVLRPSDGVEVEQSFDGAVAAVEFWKLVAVVNEETGGLHATAYLLSQGQLIRRLMETRSRRETLEGFRLGPYRTFQIRIADLAEATGYDFSACMSADPLNTLREITEAVQAGEPIALPLHDWAQIRL